MAILNFPNEPTKGEVYEAYVWDDEKWLIGSSVPVVPTSPMKAFMVGGTDLVMANTGKPMSMYVNGVMINP
jgi:hypothetical protein